MASDLAAKAKEAFIDDHFELAVELYSQAIVIDPNNADLFSDRAQANIKLKNFTEAVADANKAIELDSLNPKAYLRKGTACFSLEEYQTAKTAFKAGSTLAPEDTRFTEWIKKCDKCIAEENGELPTQSSDVTPVAPSSQPPEKTNATTKDAEEVKNISSQVITTTPPKPKYRHEFYQKPEEVVVTIFAKGIPANSVSINYGEQIVSVTIDVPGEDSYIFQPRLFGKIIPARCRYEVLSTKVEIRLAKAEPIHWTSLEFGKSIVVAQRSNVSTVGTQRPTYPSSKPTKDWDNLEAQVKKEEKDEKLDGDAALNKFFRDIYKDADDDTRRAMIKSFVESNGTVVSKNWKEVGSKMVEGSPSAGRLPIFIDAPTIRSVLSYRSLITHLQTSLASATFVIQSPIRHSHQTSSSSTLLLMPSWSLSSTSLPYIGVKLVTTHPNNSTLNLPGVHASYVLFNSVTGETLASMDGTEITLRRTACVSAVASHYLSNKNSRALLSVGAGSLAPHLIKAHLTTRPSINHVMIWNRTPQKSKKLVEEIGKETGMEGVQFEACEDIATAAAMADIVSCATNSETPLVLGKWLKAGAHLDLVGSYKPSMMECDDEAVRRGRVFVDNEAALVEAGELVGAFERGVMKKDEVAGDLVGLIKGEKTGRKEENEITVFVSVGSAIVDLLSAQLVYETITTAKT